MKYQAIRREPAATSPPAASDNLRGMREGGLVYGKVFRSMWDGTLGPRWEVWSVFVFLVAHSDADGVVQMTPEAISARSGIPLETVGGALVVLCTPDPRSRSAAEDGRRLVPVDEKGWGWQIVNYLHYRSLRDETERRRQNREAQARYKSKQRSAEVSRGKPRSAQEEAEAVKKNLVQSTGPVAPSVASPDGAAPAAPEGPSSASVLLPTNRSGEEVGVSEEDAAEMARLYPAVDVSGALLRMRAWLLANPKRRKTKRGMSRFINAWLSREQDRPHEKPGDYDHAGEWDRMVRERKEGP